VLITGATGGLGTALASRLHDRGLRVVLAARDLGAARSAAQRIGPRCDAVELDVTADESVASARKTVGPVDVLINNAGIMIDGGQTPLTIPLDLVSQHIAVNALGAWRVSQAFVPDMVRAGWGRVVMVSSGTGAFSNGIFTGAPAYSVSKTTLNAITVLLATQTRDTGVLVNAVNPGLVRTRMAPQARREPEDAAVDIEYAVTLPEDGPSGVFFRSGHQIDW
jgi:NAD(P)-dependent dehydrogenase (short-subunit alcohol dehydrogenase family)